jgi:hypothetical protein
MIATVRFARADERPLLMKFIDEHWRKDHILSVDAVLFDWQYLDRERGRYNFVIYEDAPTGTIQAILGFIPLAQFDPAIPLDELIWLAIWKVTPAFSGQKIGKDLLGFLAAQIKPKIIAANAISPSATHRYIQAGWRIGRLDHHYMLNPDVELKLAKAPDSYKPAAVKTFEYRTIEIVDPVRFAEQVSWFHTTPAKTPRYFSRRYFEHPTYEYIGYRIRTRAYTDAMFIVRVCEHEGAKAIRIVDFIGNPAAMVEASWQRLLRMTGAEYVDIYSSGIDVAVFQAAGFLRRQDGDGAIIPNYFEPFENRNVEIDTMISGTPFGFRTFKGDSDQDRPSMERSR